jgi:hypothetical protein
MKTKVLAMMLLAGGSMFAQSRFQNGFGSGNLAAADRAPVTSSRSTGHAYAQPSFNTYTTNGYAQQGFQRESFTQDRDRQSGDERDGNRSFASDHSRDNRENSRGFGNRFSGDHDQDDFRGR